MTRILYCGDTLSLAVQITTDHIGYQIPGGADVRASLVSLAGRELAGPWLIVDPQDGSWQAGVVSVPVDGSETQGLDPQSCRIEIQIEADGESITRQTNETISLRRAGIGGAQTIGVSPISVTIATQL